MRIQATIEQTGPTGGIAVTPVVVEALGDTDRPPVSVTIRGHRSRRSLAARIDGHPLSAGVQVWRQAGVVVGGQVKGAGAPESRRWWCIEVSIAAIRGHRGQ